MSKENLLLIQKVVNILAAVVLLLASIGSALQLFYASTIANYYLDPKGLHRVISIISFTLGVVFLTQVFVNQQLSRNSE